MSNIKECLDGLLELDGAMAAALVDYTSGMSLGNVGNSDLNLDVAAAGNSEVIKSKLKVMSNLGLKDEIDDILISLGKQYHLIRLLKSHKNLFVYYVLNKNNANLAMARLKLGQAEQNIQV